MKKEKYLVRCGGARLYEFTDSALNTLGSDLEAPEFLHVYNIMGIPHLGFTRVDGDERSDLDVVDIWRYDGAGEWVPLDAYAVARVIDAINAALKTKARKARKGKMERKGKEMSNEQS